MAQYEYKVLSFKDEKLLKRGSARLNVDATTDELNRLGSEGWHVVGSYSDPFMPAGGYYLSKHIMVLEREIN